MEFSGLEYWSGFPFPSPRDLPSPGIEPGSPTLQIDSLPSEPQGSLGWLISNKNLCLTVLKTGSPRSWFQHRQWGPLLDCRWFLVSFLVEEGKGALSGLFSKDTNPIPEDFTLITWVLPKAQLPNTITVQFSSVQLFSRVRLFATPRITSCQASLSITNSRSSLRFTSIEPSSHLILCHPLLLLPAIKSL